MRLSVRITRTGTLERGMGTLRLDELELGQHGANALEVGVVRPDRRARRDGGHGNREIGERDRRTGRPQRVRELADSSPGGTVELSPRQRLECVPELIRALVRG